jgi:WD40 repeat protein/serine/threonine protein kinase/DNA-binding SARP family transcriptional activator
MTVIVIHERGPVMQAAMEIVTLGGLQISRGQIPVTNLGLRKAEALLVYLATTQKPQSREVLADLLWDDRSQRQSLTNLRVVLTSLRKEFEPYFDISRDMVSRNPEAEIWLDAAEFEDCLIAVQRAGGISTPGEAEQLEQAVGLYQGEFLDGFYLHESRGFEEWMLRERERLHRLAVSGLHDLVRYDLQRGNYPAGIQRASRLLALDPLSESGHRQMMQLLAYSGRRSEALAQYETCRQLLWDELAIEPSASTKAMYEKIRAGALVRSKPPLRVIRGYELQEQIGSGSHGAIYRALQPGVGREVAVKIILPQYANDPEFIRRFEIEAQTIARLEHPFIVPLYDYWREPDGAYLVMRWVRGGSLEQHLADGPLKVERVLHLAQQIAEALNAAHQQGVVHRDLKPANILVDEAGNGYLSDFGIAKQFGSEIDPSLTGGLIGSPAHMSPEQLLHQPVTPRSDIYSFGVLLYQMLTGEVPFQVASLAALIDKHLHEPLPAVTALRPDLPAQVDAVLRKAAAKEPELRYPDAPAVCEALEAALSGSPILQPEHVQPVELAQGELHNPYKGLLAFQETDAGVFFGRESLVERLLAKFVGNSRAPETNGHSRGEGRFLAVVGPSGGGKSSLVKAGLIPALRAGRSPGSENWFIVEMLPGTHPLEELEATLLRVAVNPPPSLISQLREDERGLVRAVKRVLPGGEEAELVLVIDQFEEVFTLAENREDGRFFMDSLVSAVSDPRGRVRVVITLRADFYDRPLMVPVFSELVRAGTEVVVPLTAEELVAAIQKPAARVGARFEDGLVPRIVADVSEQPGALPLLQYSLTELFERREGGQLTKAGYQQIGGVLGALSRRAEAIYQGLDSSQQAVARQVFLRLVTLGEGDEDTRRRTLRSELETLEDLPGQVEGSVEVVVDAFGRARLLAFDRDPASRGPTVEVAHEALLREWARLRRWLEESREDIRMQRLVGQLAKDWEGAGRDASFLLRGGRLELIEHWREATQIALTRTEQAYLEASLAEREARQVEEAARQEHQAALERRSRNFLRALILVMTLATVLSLYLAGFAFRQRDDAQQAALAEAAARRDATARELVGFAKAELQNPTDPTFNLELLLARQSVLTTWQADQTHLPEAELALRDAINAAPILDKKLLGHTSRVNFAAWSPDGERVVSAGADGKALVFDAESERQLFALTGHTSEINTAAWSPDGRRILTASQDRTVRVWDSSSGKQVSLYPFGAAAASAMWSPDGARLLVASGGTVQILDAQTGKVLLQVQGVTGDFNFAAWDPTGARIAACDNINMIQVWDAAIGARLGEPLNPNLGPVNSVQWSHSGRYLLSTHLDNLARIWDTQQQSPPLDLPHQAEVKFAAWSPDDSQVATATADGRITIWDAQTGQQLRSWRVNELILWSLAWSPDGSKILTGDGDGAARIWEAQSLQQQNSLLLPRPVLSVAWSPDGTYLLDAGGLTLAANLWNPAENSTDQLQHPASVSAVAWSPDSSQFATASQDTIYIWDTASRQKIKNWPAHNGTIQSLAWDKSGRYLASGSQDKTAKVWDLSLPDPKQAPVVLKGHTKAVRSVSWSPDGTRLVTGSSDGTARIWELQTGEPMITLSHGDEVNAVTFSPDGEMVLTASSDQTARIWDAQSGELLHTLLGSSSPILSAAWSPDGSRVATAGEDGSVLLWDPYTGTQIEKAAQHTAEVWSLAWSPDGNQLASASQDDSVQISTIGIEALLDQADKLITRTIAKFDSNERCTYLHDCPP